MTDVTIYHNPRCSKSRETLGLLRERGIEPTVVEYLTIAPRPGDPRPPAPPPGDRTCGPAALEREGVR